MEYNYLFDYLFDRISIDENENENENENEESISNQYYVSEFKPITQYTLLCNGSSVFYCCWISFFTRMRVECHHPFICPCSLSPTTDHDASQIDILVPMCLFLLSKTASPIQLCSLLPSIIQILAQNENITTTQLLHFLLCDCIRPIPGVLGVQFPLGDNSTTISVPYGNEQLPNCKQLSTF